MLMKKGALVAQGSYTGCSNITFFFEIANLNVEVVVVEKFYVTWPKVRSLHWLIYNMGFIGF